MLRISLKLPNWKDFAKSVFRFWLRRYKLFFFLFFLSVALLGAYQWRLSLVTFRWSPEERRSYLESTIKETVFDEAKFLKTLEERRALDQRHAEDVAPAQIVFPGGTKKESER